MQFLPQAKTIFYPVVALAWSMIYGCNSPQETPVSSEPRDRPKLNCPQSPNKPPLIEIDRQGYGFYDAFNYQIENIKANSDTIAFESSRYKFTLCRGNNDWTIKEKSNSNIADVFTAGKNSIEFQNQTYKYGVELTRGSSRQEQEVIFELTTPESDRIKQQKLYDLEQTIKARAGVELEYPVISEAIPYGDRLFWSVFAYHSEGFGGIATIVSYDPATDTISVIQPPELARQIINDFVIAGNPEQPTFWIATKLTAEGSPDLPTLGLVSYRPDNSDYTSSEINSYRVDNSPLVGAIPSKLYLERDLLWIATGNGICQVKWQSIENQDSWRCWQFALMSELPKGELPVYSSLLDDTPQAIIEPNEQDKLIKVLWWMPRQHKPLTGRFEIEYEPQTVILPDMGATTWEEYYGEDFELPVWRSPIHWVGNNWHWNGQRFARGFDEVNLNLVGGGPRGINDGEPNADYIFDNRAIRGDLELLELTESNTKLKHYSAWVDDNLLRPYLTIAPQARPNETQLNPLLEIQSELER